jgi:RNA polymerase sigma factor (sigma-70 family)
MARSRTHRVIDHSGAPLADRLQRVLDDLSPRLRRHFSAQQDETAVTEILEEAGRRITFRERRGGPIEKLHGYAWVTLRSVATSRMRLGSTQVIQRTLESNASAARLAASPAVLGSVEQIESNILLREVLARLSPEERLICVWKKSGFSSQEIADYQGRSVAAVDTLFCRAKQKIRRFLGVERGDGESDKLARAGDA